MYEKRFYVYHHIEIVTGKVAYVGRGSAHRFKSKENRTKPHLEIWDLLEKVIVTSNLTYEEASQLEFEHLQTYNCQDLFNVKITKHGSLPLFSMKETLNEYFHYDESSPSYLTWKKKSSRSNKIGDIAGCLSSDGYYRVRFQKKLYLAHRVVCALFNMDIDSSETRIDHKDGNRSNNNIKNLSVVSVKENNQNRATSGIPQWMPNSKRWIARWKEYSDTGAIQKSKTFTPHLLYPNLPELEAIEKAKVDAINYQDKMKMLHYSNFHKH